MVVNYFVSSPIGYSLFPKEKKEGKVMYIAPYGIFSTPNLQYYNAILDKGYKYYVVYRIKNVEKVAFFYSIETAFYFRKNLIRNKDKIAFVDIVGKAKYRRV